MAFESGIYDSSGLCIGNTFSEFTITIQDSILSAFLFGLDSDEMHFT